MSGPVAMSHASECSDDAAGDAAAAEQQALEERVVRQLAELAQHGPRHMIAFFLNYVAPEDLWRFLGAIDWRLYQIDNMRSDRVLH